MKRSIAPSQRTADRRVIELREPAHCGRVQESDPQQPFADRAEIGRTALNQTAQSGATSLQAHVLVEYQTLDLIQSAAIAEDDAQLADAIAHLHVLRSFEPKGQFIP